MGDSAQVNEVGKRVEGVKITKDGKLLFFRVLLKRQGVTFSHSSPHFFYFEGFNSQ